MTHALPEPSHADKLLALRAAIDEAHRLGVTSVQTVSYDDEEINLLKEIREQGDLSLRVYGLMAVPPALDEARLAQIDTLRAEYPDDPTLKLGGVEVICPCEPDELQRTVGLLDGHGWNVTVHAARELDVRGALDAFERISAADRAPAHERRYRLHDVQAIAAEDLERLSRLPVIAGPFDSDAPASPTPLWTTLGAAGVRLLFASNWPAASFDPRDVIEDAIGGEAGEAQIRPVIDAYTGEAAYASFDEQRKGRLAAGMLADIVILSNDIFEHPAESLKETAVTVTVFDGKIVYQRPDPSSSN